MKIPPPDDTEDSADEYSPMDESEPSAKIPEAWQKQVMACIEGANSTSQLDFIISEANDKRSSLAKETSKAETMMSDENMPETNG